MESNADFEKTMEKQQKIMHDSATGKVAANKPNSPGQPPVDHEPQYYKAPVPNPVASPAAHPEITSDVVVWDMERIARLCYEVDCNYVILNSEGKDVPQVANVGWYDLPFDLRDSWVGDVRAIFHGRFTRHHASGTRTDLFRAIVAVFGGR